MSRNPYLSRLFTFQIANKKAMVVDVRSFLRHWPSTPSFNTVTIKHHPVMPDDFDYSEQVQTQGNNNSDEI